MICDDNFNSWGHSFATLDSDVIFTHQPERDRESFRERVLLHIGISHTLQINLLSSNLSSSLLTDSYVWYRMIQRQGLQAMEQRGGMRWQSVPRFKPSCRQLRMATWKQYRYEGRGVRICTVDQMPYYLLASQYATELYWACIGTVKSSAVGFRAQWIRILGCKAMMSEGASSRINLAQIKRSNPFESPI